MCFGESVCVWEVWVCVYATAEWTMSKLCDYVRAWKQNYPAKNFSNLIGEKKSINLQILWPTFWRRQPLGLLGA